MLANTFLQKKWKYLGKRAGEDIQVSYPNIDFKHIPAYFVVTKFATLRESLKSLTINRKRMIIVNSSELASKLKEELNTKFIHTIEETKGLEYDATLLINIATDTEVDWRKLMDEENNAKYIEQNYHMLLFVFNLLYVSLTRARRHVAIFEEGIYAKNSGIQW